MQRSPPPRPKCSHFLSFSLWHVSFIRGSLETHCMSTVKVFSVSFLANDISNLPRQPIGLHDDAALIAIDGTWSQSKGLYYHNPRLHDAPQVGPYSR